MKTNQAIRYPAPKTHEGGPAIQHQTPIQQLRRLSLACLLWEDGFYENGVSIADHIKRLVPLCDPRDVAELAIQAREEQRLRHLPLLLCRELLRHPGNAAIRFKTGYTLARVIQRADEIAEFLSLYWLDGKKPLAKQAKLGLAEAFNKFDEYAFAKYNRDGAVKLRDVMFVVHPKPKDDAQAELFKKIADDMLATPATWEVLLSGGGDKREVFTQLIEENKLGYMALLRNLRNMAISGVDKVLVEGALKAGAAKSKALPFRYIAAARAVPQWEYMIDQAMLLALGEQDKLPGYTILLVDVSGSMNSLVSSKSDLKRIDAACALAILLRGICEQVSILSFSDQTAPVPPRTGMALADAINNSQMHSGTYLGRSLDETKRFLADTRVDRTIVITDEQSADSVGAPIGKGYMINVAAYLNGVGFGPWTRISGWSESIVRYIQELERAEIGSD